MGIETQRFDRIIIGAGIYGLYAALRSAEKNRGNILVLEKEKESFTRATYINQARVHMGYHYPRSFSTAIKSAHYFERFVSDYSSSVLREFKQIYATSSHFSWTNAKQFEKFCLDAGIDCERVEEKKYFKRGLVDGAFLTKEFTYDAKLLLDLLLQKINKFKNITILYGAEISEIKTRDEQYELFTNFGCFSTGFVLNATYASINDIINLAGFEPFKIKYELCEIILCEPNSTLRDVGITVMDGPFFSIMPFGKTGYHSLTSVTFTPHIVSYNSLPSFSCQTGLEHYCKPEKLGNCDRCDHKPRTAWDYMSRLAKKYMNDSLGFTYVKSLYSIKPILISSEIDDSRPTVIKHHSSNPYFYSVLSGKINTIYDLEAIL